MRARLVPTLSFRLAAARLMLVAMVAGCAGYGKLEPGAASDLLRQGRTIVLLQLTAENDGRRFDAISSFEDTDAYRLALVNLGSEVRQTLGPNFPSPDEEARADGWVWAAVEPGDYFLQVFAPWGWATERQERSWADNRYRISVSEAGRIQYVGSFSVRCRSTWGLLGTRVGDCPGPVGLGDETERARALSLRAFGPKAPFVAALARPYDEPPFPDEIAGAWPFRITVGGGTPWQPLDWERLRETNDAPEPGSGVGGGGGGCYGPGCGGLVLIALALWAGAEAVDEARDRQTQNKWQPCADNLLQTLPEMRIPDSLYRHVAEAMAVAGDGADAPGGREPRGLLRLDLRRIQLRKCRDPESVCVEIAVRARLTDLRSGEVLYEATPVYTSTDAVPTGGYPPRPYGTAPLPHHLAWETATAEPAPCLGFAAICGAGAERFRPELENGLRAIAAEIARNLRPGVSN